MPASGRHGNDAHSPDLGLAGAEARREVAGTDVEQPLGAGVEDALDLRDPVDRVDDRPTREPAGLLGVETAGVGPRRGEVGGGVEVGVVEGELRGDRLHDGRERGAAGHLAGPLVLLRRRELVEQRHGAPQTLLRPGQHDGTATVAQAGDDTSRGGQRRQGCGDPLGALPRHAEHGRAEQVTATTDDLRGGARQPGVGVEVGRVGPRQGLHHVGALGVPRGGDRRRRDDVEALALERGEAGQLGQQDAGHGHGGRLQRRRVGDLRRVVVLGRLADGERVEPGERRDVDARAQQLGGDRRETLLGARDETGDVGLEGEVAHERGERLEPRLPLPAGDHGVPLAPSEPVDQRLAAASRGGGGARRARGGGGHVVIPRCDRWAEMPSSQNVRRTSSLFRGFPHVLRVTSGCARPGCS
ncbi:hypothetical protein QE370_001973 [Aeromicrobium sp. SORGH_AS981]|nr:hypothetical protein [Aeromicrobium sp. SORGH_AS_0981]MDR6118789.1 hypothetical protein [Aeromicrobium sp. SORGH_AS_0981]